MTEKAKQTDKFIVLGLIVVILYYLLYPIVAFFGHFGADDMYYAKLAHQAMNGTLQLSDDHYAYRWGVIYPLALAYWLGGICDVTSALPSFLGGFLTLVLVYKIFAKQKKKAFIAVSLTALNFWFLQYSNKIMPDVPIVFAFMAAISIFYYHRFRAGNAFICALGFVFMLFLGFITKETIAFIVPFLLVLLVSDLFQRRFLTFWAYAIEFGFILLGLYFIFIEWKTGSFLMRFRAVEQGDYFMPTCSYELLPTIMLVKRVSYQLFYLLFGDGWVALGFFAYTLFKTKLKTWINPITAEDYWLSAAFWLLLAANFMSSSFKGYSPLCLDGRHYLFILPVLNIAVTPFILPFFEGQKDKLLFILLVFAAVLACFNLQSYNAYLYIGLLGIGLGRLLLPTYGNYGTFLGVLLLFFPTLHYIKYIKSMNYVIQKEAIETNFVKKQDKYKKLVITNPIQRNFGEYYLNFDTTRIQFVAFKDLKTKNLEQFDEIYMMYCYLTQHLSGLTWEQLPTYLKQLPPHTQTIYDKKDVQLYQLDKTIFINLQK